LKILVACGGNALIRSNELNTFENQFRNVNVAARQIFRLIKLGHEVLITHGNGPQIGNLAINQEKANEFPPQPLHVLGAMTQGQVGYMLQQALGGLLRSNGIGRRVVTLVTQTLVDASDPLLGLPTKPIGPFYSKEKALELRKKLGYPFSKVRNIEPSFRRVVPSPNPVDIIEKDVISQLLNHGVVVIAAGGGGVPVVRTPSGAIMGVNCVVDKDLAAECLARAVGVDVLMILTDVEKIKINYSLPNERDIGRITLNQAKEYLAAGTFQEGSMAPKVLACTRFIESTPRGAGKRAIITSLEKAVDALNGKTGTHVTRENDLVVEARQEKGAARRER